MLKTKNVRVNTYHSYILIDPGIKIQIPFKKHKLHVQRIKNVDVFIHMFLDFSIVSHILGCMLVKTLHPPRVRITLGVKVKAIYISRLT